MLGFAAWPFGTMRVVVLSANPVDLSAVTGRDVEAMHGEPETIVAALSSSGCAHAYVDGGETYALARP